ncbi:MAG: hypothetical protein KJ792_13990 [Actinobacteria bacterium]|nr:hypothetical protein [Actinomycetota bacterium]MCG2802796.1 hypothetical protein [Cellulomonas sp.]
MVGFVFALALPFLVLPVGSVWLATLRDEALTVPTVLGRGWSTWLYGFRDSQGLRERRRPLTAFGARRRALGFSVLWQVANLVVLGIALAALGGTGVSAALRGDVGATVRVDWRTIGLTAGGAALVVLVVTAASLPLLARLTRADALHAE